MLSILPDASVFPDTVTTSINYIFGFLWNFDYIIDVSTLFTVLGLVIAFELGILVWHGIHWLIAKIPFVNIR
jgi:hypothetical protein